MPLKTEIVTEKNGEQLKTILESQMRHKYGTFRTPKEWCRDFRNENFKGTVELIFWPLLASRKEKSWSLIKGQWSHCTSFHMSLNISGHLVCNFHQPRKLQNPSGLFCFGGGKEENQCKITTAEPPIAAFVAVRVLRSLWSFTAGSPEMISGQFQSIPNIGMYFFRWIHPWKWGKILNSQTLQSWGSRWGASNFGTTVPSFFGLETS